MKNLIGKVFNRGKDKPKVETTLSPDAIKPFFEANGIDMETIGFPMIKNRKASWDMNYHCLFDKVNIKPVVIDGEVSTIITGKYSTQASNSYRGEDGIWRPGGATNYYFKIQNGELRI